jgi:hypothetical protein
VQYDLEHNNIKDKPIPNSYPQLQGKVEAYNKIVKNEFISVAYISSIDKGKIRYDMFFRAYNDKREHGGINVHLCGYLKVSAIYASTTPNQVAFD